MFEKQLADKMKRIFDLKKASYSIPSESHEEECVFIQVQSSKNNVKDGRFVGIVKGKIMIFGSIDKLPYGYISKALMKASLNDVQNLFFYDFEENVGATENISERSASFNYLFDMQYDPNQGQITSLNTISTVGNNQ